MEVVEAMEPLMVVSHYGYAYGIAMFIKRGMSCALDKNRYVLLA